ncbi:hypothetical protein U9M48_006943 [Paspalum notatum var. saurae]|uniref:Uncharacterized protein n=1 Tax=Paspalum notatum var. saurae TaxID=547442 RepID=A0AAQ3Q0Z2_PASNO
MRPVRPDSSRHTRVAPLVSLHHLDRLSPVSPNSLRRLRAVPPSDPWSVRPASRRDPARTLLAAPTPLRTFRGWYGTPAGAPFTVNTRPEAEPDAAALPCHRRPNMFYLDRVTERTAPAAGRNWTR